MVRMGLLALALSIVARASSTYSVTVFTTTGGGTGINNSGQMAGTEFIGNTTQATIGGPSGSTAIPLPSGCSSGSNGAAVNDSGQVTGSACYTFPNFNTFYQAFIGTVAGSTVIPLPAGWTYAGGLAVNGSGQVAGTGGRVYRRDAQAFIGTVSGSAAIPFPDPSWSVSNGNAVNASGQVTGFVGSGTTAAQAYIGTTSGSTVIPLLPGWSSMQGFGINDSGQIAGFGRNGTTNTQAFVATISGSTAIPLPVGDTDASVDRQSINNLGMVVGGSSAPGSPYNLHGWIWDASDGTVPLSALVPVGWNVTNAISISNNGLILAQASFMGGAVQSVELTPTACSFSLTPPSISFGASGGNGSLTVTTASGCDWQAISNSAWLTITAGSSGTGNGTVNFNVGANPGPYPQAGSVIVGGQTFTVNQAPIPPAPPTLVSPTMGGIAGLAPSLSWNASSGATSYDVYFGTSPTPPLVTNVSTTTYSPGMLVAATTYYWRIVAKNSGGTGASAISSFTTLLHAAPLMPVADFDGNGYQDVFFYDAHDAWGTGTGYAGLSNGSGLFTYVYNAFTPGFDTIRYGDFNGDGKTDLIVYNRTTALGYVLLGKGDGTFSPVSLFLGPGFDHIATGDLNGDGLTDFVMYRGSDGTCYTALSNGDGTFRYQYTLVTIGFTNMAVADFNGDGKADLFLYRSSDGVQAFGTGNGSGGFTFPQGGVLGPYGVVGADFVEAGDIDGDGKADLLFYSSASGATAVGISTGSNFTIATYAYSPGFTTVKLFDFNADGKADLAFYNKNNSIGYLGVGSGTGAFTFSSLFWGAGMDTVDTLDLNADGRIDVVIYNSTNGASYTGISSGVAASPFSYQYAYWGNGKVLATAAAQP
jgi:hypothetical protein